MMTSATVVVVLVGLGIGLIVAGAILAWRRSAVRPGSSTIPSSVSGAPAGQEALAAPASETIEDLANQRLAAIPGLAGKHVDFGTAADGSLEIWVGDERYTSVDEIRDPRIRQAVQDAVAAFNR